MQPSYFHLLAALPITTNGKLDRQSLLQQVSSQKLKVSSTHQSSLIELTLQQIISPFVIGQTLTLEANFFQLGLDSLATIDLCQQINEQLNWHLTVADLFQAPSIAQLIHLQSKAPQQSAFEPLLTLNENSDIDLTLYCIHPANGLGWCYRHLAAALTPALHTVALQSPAFLQQTAIIDQLDVLAQQYAKIIAKDPQRRSKIALLGWSVGGNIAHTLAFALQKLNIAVEHIFILDAYPCELWQQSVKYGATGETQPAWRALLLAAALPQTAIAAIKDEEMATTAQILNYLQRQRHVLGFLPEFILQRMIDLIRANLRLLYHSKQQYHAIATTLFEASEQPLHNWLNINAWRPFMAANWQVIKIAGHHAEIVQNRASQLIASQIQHTFTLSIPENSALS